MASHLDGEYALFAVAMAPFPEAAAQGRADAAALCAALAPWSTGSLVLNFTEAAVDPAPMYGDRWERLRAARAVADPSGVFVGHHPVG